MFKQVKYDNHGLFTAKDEMGRKVTIQESISFIFTATEWGGEDYKKYVSYEPVDYHDAYTLEQVEKFLCGKPYIEHIVERVIIRYGWMDKRLNKLSFIPLTTFMEIIRGARKEHPSTGTDKRKLVAICKQLSLSMKHVVK